MNLPLSRLRRGEQVHLEHEIGFELDQSRRCIAAEEGTQDRRWRVDSAENDAITTGSVLHVILRLREVRMIEHIEELDPQLQACRFPFRNPEAFDNVQVRVGVVGAEQLIAKLLPECGCGGKKVR